MSQEENSQEFRNDALLESYFLQDALKKIESNPKEFEDSSNLSKTGKSKIIPIPEQHTSKDSMRNLEGQHFAATLNPELPSYTHLDEDRQQSSSAPERKASHMRASAKEQTNDDEMEH